MVLPMKKRMKKTWKKVEEEEEGEGIIPAISLDDVYEGEVEEKEDSKKKQENADEGLESLS